METKKPLQFLRNWHRATGRFWLKIASFVKHLPWRRIGITGGIVGAVLVVAYVTAFFWPRDTQFSYSGATCVVNPVLLPGLVKAESSQGFDASLTHDLSIGGLPLYSHTICITARQAPKEGANEQVKLAPFGWAFKKAITVAVAKPPAVSAVAKLDTPVSAKAPLIFKLDAADTIFDYRLTGNNQTAPCAKAKENQLQCDLPKLNLAQATQYEISLERTFKNQPAQPVLKSAISTITPIGVVGSSIAWGEVVYGAPTTLTLTLNKPAASYEGLKLTAGGQELPITHSLSEATITVQFSQPLPRSAQLALSLQSIIAKDLGYSDAPFALNFSTSGGPKVLGVNIGTYKVSTGASITITFDSNLAAGQNLGYFIRAERDAGQMDATYTLRGKTVTITPRAGIPHCTAFNVKVYDGLKNEAGISGGSGYWQYNSRTLCQTVFSIGSSVNGRSILAYKFGNGGSKVVFVGGIHGDERNATSTMNSFIDYLEANVDKIPGHRSIIIIPVANPDGYAANSRYNARGVDLNRNFPVSNWKPGVTGPDGVYREYGGGTSPLSEPESSALANFVGGQGARLVMSYHAPDRLVAANEAGDSRAIATNYGRQTGYRSYGNEAGGHFGYDTTGAFEDWLAEDHGVGCLLVELGSKSGNEFNGHRNALLSLVQL